MFLFKYLAIMGIFIFTTLNLQSQALTDNALLDIIQQGSVNFFLNAVDTSTYLTADNANNFNGQPSANVSIASVGYGLVSLCVAQSRGWISKQEAIRRITIILSTFKTKAAGTNGFYYHMLNYDGSRNGTSEVSSVDTAFFLAGTLFAADYFNDSNIKSLAQGLYNQCNWNWLCNGSDFISMGWKPERINKIETNSYSIQYGSGWLDQDKYQYFDEGLFMDVLACGAKPDFQPLHAPVCWISNQHAALNYTGGITIPNIRVISNGGFRYNPLYLYQDLQLWVDLRTITTVYEPAFNYFTNSIKATLANRQFCMDQYSSYGCSSNVWGFTVCQGPNGGARYGAEPWVFVPVLHTDYDDDGTVAFTASGGSLEFTPTESIKVFRYMYENYQQQVYGLYGFCDAFNLHQAYYCPNVVGIDQGPIIMSIENYRTGMIWDVFMQDQYINNGLTKIGFSAYTRPNPIADLKIQNGVLTWTSPGEMVGTANVFAYEIKALNRAITSYADWYDINAQVLPNSIKPSAKGVQEQYLIPPALNSGTYYFAIRAVDANNHQSILTANNTSFNIIGTSFLYQNYPNPFKLSQQSYTTIKYNIATAGHVQLKLYTINAELVKTWDEGNKQPFNYYEEWNGCNSNNHLVSTGVYLLILQLDGSTIDSKKIAFIR